MTTSHSGLWPRRTVGVFVMANLLAIVLIFVASAMAADQLVVSHQMPWVNTGTIALIVAGLGNATLLLNGRRAVVCRTHQFRVGPSSSSGSLLVMEHSELVAVADTTLYHYGDCVLVNGKSVEAASREAHEMAARRPCGVCSP